MKKYIDIETVKHIINDINFHEYPTCVSLISEEDDCGLCPNDIADIKDDTVCKECWIKNVEKRSITI